MDSLASRVRAFVVGWLKKKLLKLPLPPSKTVNKKQCCILGRLCAKGADVGATS